MVSRVSQKAMKTTPHHWADRTLLAAALVFCCTLLAYWPALEGGLLWDDAAHVTRPELRSLHGLWRIWFELGATQQYYPVLHSAFWIEYKLWGDAMLGYHLANLSLHAAAACLVLLIMRRLRLPGAGRRQLLRPVRGQTARREIVNLRDPSSSRRLRLPPALPAARELKLAQRMGSR